MSRPPLRIYRLMMADAVFKGLLDSQEGGPISAVLRSKFLMSRYFKNTKIQYVLVEAATLSPPLMQTIQSWPLRLLDQDGTMRLYQVIDSTDAQYPNRRS